jgi:S1-C subfamily serine protease
MVAMKKKTLLLCIFSAGLGAALALVLANPPGVLRQTGAQEPVRGPRVVPAAQPRVEINTPETPANGPPSGDEYLTLEERVNIAVYEKVNRSAVNIDTRSVRTDFFFEVPTRGAGSGVVLDQQGHILTNFHVVEDARAIQVTLFDGKSYEATPVGADPTNDVAVLKIDAPAETLHPVVLGDSTGLRVGQRAIAIGNPFGLERTLSVGVISSLNRPLSERRGAFKQLIQIDADINPGNSGGPLLDSRGRMIGMNTVIASKTGQSAGVGFAIPVNAIARILPELIEHGRVVRADIGIVWVWPTPEGLRIAELASGGAAERAGLRGPRLVVRETREGPLVRIHRSIDRSAADLIVGVDGQRVRTADEFLSIIEGKKPGDEVTVNVIREGRPRDVRVKLDADD